MSALLIPWRCYHLHSPSPCLHYSFHDADTDNDNDRQQTRADQDQPVVALVTPDDMQLLLSTVTVAWLLLATVVIDDVVIDDAVDDAVVFGVVLTANIFPWFVRMYTPFGVLITRTFSPAGILLGPESVDVLVPGIMMSA